MQLPFFNTTCNSPLANGKKLKAKGGFTLIELLVVITIIGILVGIGTVAYTKAQQRGRDSKRKADLKAVQQALETYFQTNNTYPADDGLVGPSQIKCPAGGSIVWGTSFTCYNITYMSVLPKDPGGNGDINYRYNAPGNGPTYLTYVLSAKLENGNDPDTLQTNNPCTLNNLPENRNYCVINP